MLVLGVSHSENLPSFLLLFSFSEVTICNKELGGVIMQKSLFIFTLVLLEVES